MSDILEQGEDDYKISLTKSTKLKLKVSILKIISIPFLYNCILPKRTFLDEMDYQSMKYQMKIYKDPATC